jgi:hypothetical protein
MDIKTELKNFIHERFKVSASTSFIERALAEIERASNEKESLAAAADKVSKMISLFIDKDLGEEIYGNLKEKIDKGFPES